MIIEYSSKSYPQRLREIEKPPSRLYLEGNIELLSGIGIAVIGSRTNTLYGEKMCKKFVKGLVKYNINIISGLALGIDSIAHKQCLKNSSKTIAVLPSGLKNIYPKEHRALANEIIKNDGLIVSEYEPEARADSKKFLERNRIVAGLGIGTLVIEAGHRSGTSVTARYTRENGKPIFCVPSSLENTKGAGTNELIKRGGNLVTDVDDIINFYTDIEFSIKELVENDVCLDIEPDLIDVYKVMTNIPQDINEIARKTGLPISEINYKTMLLQLDDKVVELPGQRFIRKENDNE